MTDLKQYQRNNEIYIKKLRENPTKAEVIVKEWLQQEGIRFIFQKGFLKPFHRIVDFYIPKAKVILEIDGPCHVLTAEKDFRKDKMWKSNRRMKTLRISNKEVYNGKFKEIIPKFFYIISIK